MASISNVKIEADLKSDGWLIRVTYTVTFTPPEIAQHTNFKCGFQLWEEDSGPDQKLSGTVGLKSFHATADHNGTVTKTSEHLFSASTLNTEPGNEELYAVVRLRNTDLNVLMPTKRSPTLSVPV